MHRSAQLLLGGTLFLAACATTGSNQTDEGFVEDLPEAVIALAAPFQDLTTVRLDPASGCYLYRHVGPVETTFLPLLTRDGRPICTRAPEPAA